MSKIKAPRALNPETEFPAKAGIHFSAGSQMGKWVPAFTGNPVWFLAPGA